MKAILAKVCCFFKYLLFIFAFALTLLGVIMTYKRLDKNLVESIYIFIPFLLVFIALICDLFIKSGKGVRKNLLMQLTSCLVFIVIILIGVRAKFDTNMLLYYKYGISYNPLYFSDNLSFILSMLYFLFFAHIFLFVKELVESKGKKKEVVNS